MFENALDSGLSVYNNGLLVINLQKNSVIVDLVYIFQIHSFVPRRQLQVFCPTSPAPSEDVHLQSR